MNLFVVLLVALLLGCGPAATGTSPPVGSPEIRGTAATVQRWAMPSPYQLIETTDGHVWVSSDTVPGAVYVFDQAGLSLAIISTGAAPNGLAQDAQGLVWVAEMGSNSLSAFDPMTFLLVRTMPAMGVRPYGLLMVKGLLYATLQGDNALAQIDPDRGVLLQTLPIGTAPHNMTSDGLRLYVANEISHNVTVVDVASFTVIRHLQTENGFLVNPRLDRRGRLWVTGYHDGHVFVFDQGVLVQTLEGAGALGLMQDGDTMVVSFANVTLPGAVVRYALDGGTVSVQTMPGGLGLRNLLQVGAQILVCDFEGQAVLALAGAP